MPGTFRAVPARTRVSRRSIQIDEAGPDDSSTPSSTTPHGAAPPSSSKGNLMSAIGKHTIEADRRAAEAEKKRKRDRYGEREGREVLRKYKFGSEATSGAVDMYTKPSALEEERKDVGELGVAVPDNFFDDQLEEGHAFIRAHPTRAPLSTPKAEQARTKRSNVQAPSLHREAPHPPQSVPSHNQQRERPAPPSHKTPSKTQSAPITPQARPRPGGRRQVPQYDEDNSNTASSPYTAPSSNGPVTPRTPNNPTPTRSSDEAKAARMAAIKNAGDAHPSSARHTGDRASSTRSENRSNSTRKGRFIGGEASSTSTRSRAPMGRREKDEYADSAFDQLLARVDFLDDGVRFEDVEEAYGIPDGAFDDMAY